MQNRAQISFLQIKRLCVSLRTLTLCLFPFPHRERVTISKSPVDVVLASYYLFSSRMRIVSVVMEGIGINWKYTDLWCILGCIHLVSSDEFI